MRESFLKVESEDLGEPIDARLVAMRLNEQSERVTRHKEFQIEYTDQAKKEVLFEVGNLEKAVEKLTKSVDKLTDKIELIQDYLHKLELSQVKENGKLWAKIAALSATMGGAGYFLAHWIKGLK